MEKGSSINDGTFLNVDNCDKSVIGIEFVKCLKKYMTSFKDDPRPNTKSSVRKEVKILLFIFPYKNLCLCFEGGTISNQHFSFKEPSFLFFPES